VHELTYVNAEVGARRVVTEPSYELLRCPVIDVARLGKLRAIDLDDSCIRLA
jgi:hypothetical protein